MSKDHSTPGYTRSKPAKPRPDFPLFAHAAGVWAKKIRGKLHYFGPWDDPDGALAKYEEQKDALHSGRTPRPNQDGLTVKALVNAFLFEKEGLVDNGELSQRTWDDYKTACAEVLAAFGSQRLVVDLRPDDFAMLRKRLAKRWGPYRLGNTIQYIRSAFKYAFDAELVDRPLRFGPSFAKPSKKTIRRHRAEQGLKLFTPEEVRKLLAAAGTPMKAMLLLAINCGFGNADCGALPLSALDLERGFIDFPRPKTGIPRRCLLWPETVEAIREALDRRPEPKDEAHVGLVFITKYGASWFKDIANNPVSKETRKLLDALDINGHRNFYTLRHTFRTVADESKDQPAVDFIMGHEVQHMSSVYRERIADERLKAVADHVRGWLFPPAEKKAKKLRARKAEKAKAPEASAGG
jgi:integrase